MSTGKHSHTGTCFDIGNGTSIALEEFNETGNPYQGEESLVGNGALCRVIPIIIHWRNNKEMAMHYASDCAKFTNGDEESLKSIVRLANLLWNLIQMPIIEPPYNANQISQMSRNAIPSGGYAPETLLAALWSVETTDNFKNAVLKCANLGDDADSTASVAGAIAGAKYGLSAIPVNWYKKLAQVQTLDEIIKKLISS